MTEFGITADDRRRINEAIENGVTRLRKPGPPQISPTKKNQLLCAVKDMHRMGCPHMSSRGIGRYLDENVAPSQIGMLMSRLAEEGYVERIGDESPYRWRIPNPSPSD